MSANSALLVELAKFVASLVAILAVSWLVARMKLGNDVRLRNEAEAADLARIALCGFEPAEIVLDRAGIGALLRDAGGRVLLLRRHGAQFAARILDTHAHARLDRTFLTVGTDDRHFGTVTLDLGDQAQLWASSLRRLGA
ncbi:MAG: hypothetical protein KGM49_01945 [Sphingomonadales bacterium]|nr:hypothetical protein [Sphingomonadales bacterium]